MMDDAFEADPIVTRKTDFWDRWERDHPPIPPFVCVSCDRTIKPDPYLFHHEDQEPICLMCVRNFGQHLRPTRITRGDHRVLMRLKAITERLQWEIINGPTARAFTPR